MIKPTEKALFSERPASPPAPKGVQRGPVVILKTDPYSIPGTQGDSPRTSRKNARRCRQAIAEVNANKSGLQGRVGADSRREHPASAATAVAAHSPNIADTHRADSAAHQAMVDAGALGTIPRSPPGQKRSRSGCSDGYVPSWDKLPVLPDIKLAENQYNEIKALAEKGEPVELEFDIRNWFKMGPIKYHNVVATLRGTTYPDEYVVIGGHFDCFSGATGGVDDGSGFAPGMEAIRLIKAAGAQPKCSIIFMLFAAEENGLVGSQSWLKKHPEIQPKIVMMINRDGSPSAITGASVPETWYADFQRITAPLTNLNPKWPFRLERALPRAHATSAGGTDSSSFEMVSVPTLNFRTQTDYVYNHAWHTLYDTYSELVPYTEHQKHSALVTAVVAYGAANLDKAVDARGGLPG